MKLTLNLLTTTIVAPPSNASKWQMGFNSAFKGFIFLLLLKLSLFFLLTDIHSYYVIQGVILELDSDFLNIFTRQIQLARIKQLHFSQSK
jgi:hypothetical protein